MKRWSESAAVWRRARELDDRGRSAALATLFELEGSGYRRPGAKMLIESDGSTLGGVSAGCVEADLVERAGRILDGAPAEIVAYATGADEAPPWGLRTGCRGTLRVLLQRVSPRPEGVELEAVEAAFGAERPFAVETRWGSEPGRPTVRVRSRPEIGEPVVRGLGTVGFVEGFDPPPWLTIVGAGPGAVPLARLARTTGFRVRAVDPRPEALDRLAGTGAALARARPGDPWPWEAPGERTFVVLQTHDLDRDRAWMRAIFAAGRPAYVGVLGSRSRGADVAAEAPPEARDRVYAPVGLDVGAEGPEEIAVAAVAEMLAVRSGRPGGSLRRGTGALHAVAG